jgi:hypothetical protein
VPDINVNVGDQFLHPPIGTLRQHLDGNGPYGPGTHTLTTWSLDGADHDVSDSFGVLAQVNGAIPSSWGYKDGWVSPDAQYDAQHYYNRICQLVVQQFLGGAWITTQLLDAQDILVAMLWEVALPGRLGLWVPPALAIDLYFLRIL